MSLTSNCARSYRNAARTILGTLRAIKSEHRARSNRNTERDHLGIRNLEAEGLEKLENYQNFARAFRVPDYGVLMANVVANAAALKRADDFRDRSGFDIADFGQGVVRAVLYAIYKLGLEAEPDVVMDQLRGIVENYYRKREDLIEIAEYLASQRGRDDEREGRYAGLLAQLIRNERIG